MILPEPLRPLSVKRPPILSFNCKQIYVKSNENASGGIERGKQEKQNEQSTRIISDEGDESFSFAST